MDGAFKLKHENPRTKANFISKLFFAWTVPLFYKGSKRRIKLTDLYKTLPSDKSESLGDKLEYHWAKQVKRSENEEFYKPSLLKALVKTFFWDYSVCGTLLLVYYVGLRSFQPLVLAWLVRQFESDTTDKNTMYLSATVLNLMALFGIFLAHHANLRAFAVGMRVRVALSSLIYRKIVKLNRASQGQTATGQVINILSNDVQRFDVVTGLLHFLWIAPIQVALVTYLMWNEIGVYCFVGIGLMIAITIPLQTYFGKLASRLRMQVATRCDARVKHMSEIISGIQVIKMYAWEKPFERLIEYLRAREIAALTKSSHLKGFYSSCNVLVERLALFLTVVTYTLLGHKLSADVVFPLASFFNGLQLTITIIYPLAVNQSAESWVAIKRLEAILTLDEKQDSIVEKAAEKGVKLGDVTAGWLKDRPILKGLRVRVLEGQLCAVIGPVGAGKSSLLQLLLGELPPSKGQVQIGGSISYSSQEPWLFAASVRKNILFGKPYDSALYKKVSEVCALEKDFERLPHGDRTMVGERGGSLSGGQRARINLARAVYRQSDVYLMDDPLSAVDTRVGKHLFERCILNYLGNKTRILVTHQLQFLKRADLIIVLNEGKIEAQGTFEQLTDSNLDFTKLLKAADECPEEDKEEPPHRAPENPNLILTRKFSIISKADSNNLEQTVRDDNDESFDYKDSSPFTDYLKSIMNYCLMTVVCLLFVASMVACTATDYWVAFWTTQETLRGSALSLNDSLTTFYEEISSNGVQYNLLRTEACVYIYTALILSAICFTVSRAFCFYNMAMKASTNIHKNMFHCLLQAPMRFFDTNPSGRVLNRFSKDMGAIDDVLPKVMMDAMSIILLMTGILINVVISNYYMAIAILLLGAIFMKLRKWYIASAKDIKHLEGIAKSPMFSLISSTLNGLPTIRAFNAETSLMKEFDERQNIHTSTWIFVLLTTVSFGLWMDMVSVTFVSTVSFGFVVATEFDYIEDGSLVGLAISQSLILTGMVQHGIKQTAELINQLTSVERVMQYSKLDTEGPLQTPEDRRPQEPFPSKGRIEFKDVSLVYVRGEPPVLKDLIFTIKPGEKVGIVGRTGAGKSSLIWALFNLTSVEGEILIDGVDTKTLGLGDLRRKISIIPQEPVLFSATLRYNLDPFGEFEDKRLWEVLEEVELKGIAQTLDHPVSEGGGNFSLGQRQLVCLARALLRDNKILVLDEATANVDARTDGLIQETIRKKCKDFTVLTIAHRLNTIMDSDKVLVMGSGKILEYEHPHELLQNPDGHFTKMVEETGGNMTEQLRQVALRAWLKRQTIN